MSEENRYAVMPYSDYQEACDAIREKTGTEDLIKSGNMANMINALGGASVTLDSIANALGYVPPSEERVNEILSDKIVDGVEPFVVAIVDILDQTDELMEFTLDKTFAETLEALNAGRVVIFMMGTDCLSPITWGEEFIESRIIVNSDNSSSVTRFVFNSDESAYIENRSLSVDVPTNLSEFENDVGYITGEDFSSVFNELVPALMNMVPSKLSDLTNDLYHPAGRTEIYSFTLENAMDIIPLEDLGISPEEFAGGSFSHAILGNASLYIPDENSEKMGYEYLLKVPGLGPAGETSGNETNIPVTTVDMGEGLTAFLFMITEEVPVLLINNVMLNNFGISTLKNGYIMFIPEFFANIVAMKDEVPDLEFYFKIYTTYDTAKKIPGGAVEGGGSGGSGLPEVSAADEGAFLRVVNGDWKIIKLPNAEEGEF